MATDIVIACHDKDGDDYHDATLVPTKLTWGLDLDVVTYHSVCTSKVGEDLCPTVCCTTTVVSEEAGTVVLQTPQAIAVVVQVAVSAGTFEVCTTPVEVMTVAVIVFKLNVSHNVTNQVSVDADIGKTGVALSHPRNVFIKSTKERGNYEGHKHVYDRFGVAVLQEHTFEESCGIEHHYFNDCGHEYEASQCSVKTCLTPYGGEFEQKRIQGSKAQCNNNSGKGKINITVITPTADDDQVTGETSSSAPENEGPQIAIRSDGSRVAETPFTAKFDPTSSDATSFGSDGMGAVCCTRVILNALTTTSIVKLDISDAAVGPEVGVDDHAFKFPKAVEPSVCTYVCPCTVKLVVEDGVIGGVSGGNVNANYSECGLTATDCPEYIVIKDGKDSNSILTEPESSPTSVVVVGEVTSCLSSSKNARGHENLGDMCSANAYA